MTIGIPVSSPASAKFSMGLLYANSMSTMQSVRSVSLATKMLGLTHESDVVLAIPAVLLDEKRLEI